MKSKSLDLLPANVADYRKLAYKKLPRQMFDYIDGGSYEEVTLAENVSAFQKKQLRQRVLSDVSDISTQTELFGEALQFPLVLAPVGLAGCFARRGEVQAARASSRQGIPFTLSTSGICSIEEVAQESERAIWFQLYVIRDRQYCVRLLKEAAARGCNNLIFTVDLAVLGERYRDSRNGLIEPGGTWARLKGGLQYAAHPRWAWDVGVKGQPLKFGNLASAVPDARSLADYKAWVDAQFDPSVTWEDLKWIRDNWHGNVIIKGIMDAEDAEQALSIGADGIVVSNHGGRQLDGVPAALDALPAIVDAVGSQTTVLVDGGVRSGLDIVKALGCGAKACLVGRAWAYALAAKGEAGVEHMIKTMQAEMQTAMALTGATSVEDLDASILVE